jgi:hypothetical protein
MTEANEPGSQKYEVKSMYPQFLLFSACLLFLSAQTTNADTLEITSTPPRSNY